MGENLNTSLAPLNRDAFEKARIPEAGNKTIKI
jgi:hypothetical protein